MEVRHGAGVFVAPGRAKPTREPFKLRNSPDVVAHRLRKMFLEGQFQSPVTLKQLSIAAQASRPTTSRALTELLADNVVERVGSRFRAYHWARSAVTVRSTIVLFARADRNGNLSMSTPRSGQQVAALEIECAQANLSLQLVLAAPPKKGTDWIAQGDRHALQRMADRGMLLGFLIWDGGVPPTAVQEILAFVAPFKSPVAILDETGKTVLSASQSKKIPLFLSSRSAGPPRAVAAHLINGGHRRVGHITYLYPGREADFRKTELMASFARKGLANAVVLFRHYSSLSQAELRQRADSVRIDVERCTLQITGSPVVARHTATAARDAMARELDLELLGRVMDEAYSHKDITAWVAVNDAVGVQCLRYLKERGCRVPQDICVVAFDDTEAAYQSGLSSYNFNVPRLMRTMINALLQPSTFNRAYAVTKGQPVDIEGFVNVRRSSEIRRNITNS